MFFITTNIELNVNSKMVEAVDGTPERSAQWRI